MENEKIYVLCPGFVASQNDNDRHYINAQQLYRLYKPPVRFNKCIVNKGEMSLRLMIQDRYVFLSPRYDGNYEMPVHDKKKEDIMENIHEKTIHFLRKYDQLAYPHLFLWGLQNGCILVNRTKGTIRGIRNFLSLDFVLDGNKFVFDTHVFDHCKSHSANFTENNSYQYGKEEKIFFTEGTKKKDAIRIKNKTSNFNQRLREIIFETKRKIANETEMYKSEFPKITCFNEMLLYEVRQIKHEV